MALGDKGWWGRYRINETDAEQLRDDVERSSRNKRKEFADSAERVVKFIELRDFATDEANKDIILKHASFLHGLLNDDFLQELLTTFDEDENKGLDSDEWIKFLHHLAKKNLEYMVVVGHVAFRAFFGRGQPWDLQKEDFSWNVIQGDLMRAAGRFGEKLPELDDVQGQVSKNGGEFLGNMDNEVFESLIASIPEKLPAPACFQAGKDTDCKSWHPFPPGWWEDVSYYSANNHPLHGIFMCDPIHPLSWIERVCMEIATWGFTMGTSVMHDRWVDEEHYPHKPINLKFLHDEFCFSMLVVTIPSMVVWWTLFLLFTCKCGQVNLAHSSRKEVRRAKWTRFIGASLAYLCCFAGIAYTLGFFMMFNYGNRRIGKYVWQLVKARLKSYAIFWFLIFFVYFNPLISWGTPDPNKPQTGIGDLIGLGQWRIEKQRFQVRCARVAFMRHEARRRE